MLAAKKCVTQPLLDFFQGDENKYVIVSLVRSSALGFLNSMNRRCVAQSRAKCGLYFVGNLRLFTGEEDPMNAKTVWVKQNEWSNVMTTMRERNCIASEIMIQCPKHPQLSSHSITEASQLRSLVTSPKLICKIECGFVMPCGDKVHNCNLSCSTPGHRHDKCFYAVTEIFPCGHSTVGKRCFEDISRLVCNARVEYTNKKCGHINTKKCYLDETKINCQKRCEYVMPCGHYCPDKCGEPHDHLSCKQLVQTKLPICGHEIEKKCSDPFDRIKCKERVNTKLRACGHEIEKKCFQDEDDIQCLHQCEKMNKCLRHKCQLKCGSTHSHDTCDAMVEYSFPGCKHVSVWKKKCSEPITWDCLTTVDVKLNCGHFFPKPCHMDPGLATCKLPCAKARDCGHACDKECGQNCNSGDCRPCRKKAKDKRKEAAARAVERLQKEIRANPAKVFQIQPIDHDSSEFFDIRDGVHEKTLQIHGWYRDVVKIEKITNLELEKRFEEAKGKAFGDLVSMKYHGTGNEGVAGIPKHGFRLPKEPGMYGRGVYFATNSSKSAQEIYTKKSNKLLLCKVLLGKENKLERDDKRMTQDKLRSQGFDSVFAPRNTKGKGGVLNDEFIVYDPDYAIPVYIIHFNAFNSLTLTTSLSATMASNKQPSFKKTVLPSRKVSQDPYDTEFRMVESHFLRMINKHPTVQKKQIASIDFVYNKTLEDKFLAKVQDFKTRKISDDIVFAYHGTPSQNVDNILKCNLDRKSREAYGPGYYFSEFPAVSEGYGKLIAFKVLPGKEYVGSDSNAHTAGTLYQSRKVQEDSDGFGTMLVINDNTQFVPFCVLNIQ